MSARDRMIENIILFSNCFLVFSFSFPKFLFNPAILAWGSSFIIARVYYLKYDLKSVFKSKVALVSIAIYGLMVLGLLWTDSLDSGKALIERSLFFLVAPLALVDLIRIDKKKVTQFLLSAFVGGVLVILLLATALAIERVHFFGIFFNETIAFDEAIFRLKREFTYRVFAENVGHHAVFLSVYIVFAFFSALYLRDIFNSIRIRKALLWISYSFLFYLFLLQSAMIIAAFGLLCVLYLLICPNKFSGIQKNLYCTILAVVSGAIFMVKANFDLISISSLAVLIVVGVLGFFVPRLFPVLSKFKLSPTLLIVVIGFAVASIFTLVQYPKSMEMATSNPSNVSARIFNWWSATEVIKDSPFYGQGTGGSREKLYDYYEEVNFEPGILYKYNEHNQYLNFWMELGVPGIVLFLIFIYHLTKESQKQNHFLFYVLIVLLVMFSFTETCLARRWGITFFLYFSVFFGYSLLFKASLGQKTG